ncbi:MAG: hypothetical protein GTO20_32040 [Candidatus Aminicenantes bacterium]|nr:hypothetical protein [Candidatus Aminicenantes bacterium]
MDKKNIQDILGLTPMQEGILSHYLKDPGSNHYFEQLSLKISGEINFERFKKAWNFVIETNEMLRTVFRWKKVEYPLQIVLKKHKLQPRYYDCSDVDGDVNEKKKKLEEIREKDKKAGFDLHDVPFRVTLCRIEKSRYEMIISNHHILYDGWSSGIILKEFFEAYDERDNRNTLVPFVKVKSSVKTKFKTFLEWIQNQENGKQMEFWETYLEGFDNKTGISVKRRRKREVKHTEAYQFKLPGSIKDEVENFVKSHNITIASLLYSLWGLLLQKYNSTNDVLFDVTVSGRSEKIKGIENIVGLFVNTLPLRVTAYSPEKISDFLSRTYRTLQRWREFENSSLVRINEYLSECHQKSLFDSLVVIENYPVDINRILKNKNSPLSVESFSFSEMTHYDLTVIVTVFDDIRLSFTYNKELFDGEMMVKLTDDFIYIINNVIENSQMKISELTLQPQSQEVRARILDYYNHIVIDDLVEDQKTDSLLPGNYAAGRGGVEERLVDIWSRLFRVDKSKIGIDRDFFDFGGHSLKARLLKASIHKEFKVKVPFAEIFKRSTIRELSNYIKESLEEKGEFVSIEPVEMKEYYPLSSAQQRIFTLQQMDLKSIAYNGPCVMIIEGQLKKERFEEVFRELVHRHESLRTAFILLGDNPFQRIHKSAELDIEYYNTNREDAKEILLNFVKPFNLSQIPLMRVRLLKIEAQRHILFVDMHHIITDGASMEILIDEIMRLYEGKKLPELEIQYKDYSEWQSSKQEMERIKKQETYWLNRFKGEIPLLKLPTDFPEPTTWSSKGSIIYFEIGRSETERLRKMISEKRITLYTLLLAVYNILLSKYTAQEDIVIGAVTSNRPYEALQNIIGLFTNFLAMRNYPLENKIFRDFLEEVKNNTLDAFENQDYQYEELIKRLNLQRKPGSDPLVEAAFTVQNMNINEGKSKTFWENTHFKMIPFEFDPGITKWTLDLFTTEYDETIGMILVYSTEIFRESTAHVIKKHFIEILKQIADNDGIRLKDIVICHDLSFKKSKVIEEHDSDFQF